MLPAFPLVQRLADTDDGNQLGAVGGPGLLRHHLVGLGMIGAALGVADDDGGTAELLQHLGGNIARVGAGRVPVTVLAAHPDLGAGQDAPHPADHHRGRADHHVCLELDVLQHGGEQARLLHMARPPFIFQFPATSARGPSLAIIFPQVLETGLLADT